MERFSLYHILSREAMDVEMFNGRITADKLKEMCAGLIDLDHTDEVFVCGPEQMLLAAKQQLSELGMPSGNIHIELFTSPDQPSAHHETWVATHTADKEQVSKVSITIDGRTMEIEIPYNGQSILDAALERGADLPYACKGGVCCTCRARLMEGQVEMEVNYSLEPAEVKKGFILTCQSHPRTPRLVVDFDER